MPIIVNVHDEKNDLPKLTERVILNESNLSGQQCRYLDFNGQLQGGHTIRDCDKKVRKNFFPYKLMEILSSPFFSDCVTWTRGGKSFFISDPDKFPEKYAAFYKKKNSPRKESFIRKLNRWGFKMELSRGPYCGSYSHPLFRQDEPWLCTNMACNKKRSCFESESSASLVSEQRSAKKARMSSPTQLRTIPTNAHQNVPFIEPNSLFKYSEDMISRYYHDDQNNLRKLFSSKALRTQQMMHMLNMDEGVKDYIKSVAYGLY